MRIHRDCTVEDSKRRYEEGRDVRVIVVEKFVRNAETNACRDKQVWLVISVPRVPRFIVFHLHYYRYIFVTFFLHSLVTLISIIMIDARVLLSRYPKLHRIWHYSQIWALSAGTFNYLRNSPHNRCRSPHNRYKAVRCRSCQKRKTKLCSIIKVEEECVSYWIEIEFRFFDCQAIDFVFRLYVSFILIQYPIIQNVIK